MLRTMWDGMDRRVWRCMRLRRTAGQRATSTGRPAGRRHCDRDMRERVRLECAGTKLLRRRDGKADMKERVGCRGLRLRITAAEALLSRGAQRLRRAHLRGM